MIYDFIVLSTVIVGCNHYDALTGSKRNDVIANKQHASDVVIEPVYSRSMDSFSSFEFSVFVILNYNID